MPTTAALVSAIEDALSPYGGALPRRPITPPDIVAQIAAARPRGRWRSASTISATGSKPSASAPASRAEEIAQQLGISRTALYRFEKGEVAKIETLEKLAELLRVSVPTLLGVGVEYIASAVSYFERMRQIEETAEHIIVLAGPISYVLASDGFDGALGDILRESRCRTASPGATARSPRSTS